MVPFVVLGMGLGGMELAREALALGLVSDISVLELLSWS